MGKVLLGGVIFFGIFLRFGQVNWSQGTNLHPDEYGLTNTLTQLHLPSSLSEYFNTRIAPLSPFHKYDEAGVQVWNGPDNGMVWGQWPITIIRWFGDQTGNTGYNEIRLLGRRLSASADTLTLLLIFLIGKRLYGLNTAMMGTALSSLAVMQIQQSHFMTVDNFGVLFAAAAMYLCVLISQEKILVRKPDRSAFALYRVTPKGWGLFAVWGLAYGMALASRINLLPLGGLLLVAVFITIADLKLKAQADLYRIFGFSFVLIVLAFAIAGLAFRVTQPMSFMAETGDTTFFTLRLNPNWTAAMGVAQRASKGICCGPPSEQWANRSVILFPLINMILWGLGAPLGLAAWGGFVWVLWRVLRGHQDWRIHALPLVWVGGYFVFMGTRFVMSMRYFLPIYPFLSLFAGYGLIRLYEYAGNEFQRGVQTRTRGDRINLRTRAAALGSRLVIAAVLGGTLLWASSFYEAVYLTDPTRIRASRWVYQNIPAPIQIEINTPEGISRQRISVPDGSKISEGEPLVVSFRPKEEGILTAITFVVAGDDHNTPVPAVRVTLTGDDPNAGPMGEAMVSRDPVETFGSKRLIRGRFDGIPLEQGQVYFLEFSNAAPEPVTLARLVLGGESWDEWLPLRIDGNDPYGQWYQGLTMEVRWYDDEKKRQMFIDNLEQVDYLILPSQRAIWSAPRIPRTYPMTMAYYRALFDGSLGFDLVGVFTAPIQIGPVFISDVGGTISWGKPGELPLFNNSLWAVEEAFSVYDHPPVWIFKKNSSFNIETVIQVLGAVDLDGVVIQNAREASAP